MLLKMTQNVTRSSPSPGSEKQGGGLSSQISKAPVGDMDGGLVVGLLDGNLVGKREGRPLGALEGSDVGHKPQNPCSSASGTYLIYVVEVW